MNTKMIGIFVSIFLISCSTSFAFVPFSKDEQQRVSTQVNVTTQRNIKTYDGWLRVYIAEINSRWYNYDGDPYHFGFLDFVIDEQLSIDYLGNYAKQVTWSAQEAGYSNVEENNIMVIAAVFNPEKNLCYSKPPNKNPFDAYFVDATAAAKPGETGNNVVTEDYTHTVFCEDATFTIGPYCPDTAEALYSLYESGDYPFYFVEMICDKLLSALYYLKYNYNLYAVPTTYFDGGYKVVLGAYAESIYRDRIENSAKREVHDMDLSVSVVWEGSGVIDIIVDIMNKEMPNDAPNKPTITGKKSGKPGTEYEYKFVSTDPDENKISYFIDWGDNTSTGWTRTLPSGEYYNSSHIWSVKGDYTIKAKAKDSYGAESDWATLEVTIPKTYITNPIFQLILRMLERFPFFEKILNQYY